jgi:hypothetical protein
MPSIYRPLLDHFFYPANAAIYEFQFPELRLSNDNVDTFQFYGQINNVFHKLPFDSFSLFIHDQAVALQAEDSVCSELLSKLMIAFDVLLPEVPGMKKFAMTLPNGGLQVGYKCTKLTKSLPDGDASMFVNKALNALVEACNRFAEWLRERGHEGKLNAAEKFFNE